MTRIACIGAVAMDRKLRAAGELRPGTSNPVTTALAPGGVARNIAENLARLGSDVSVFSLAGKDRAGDAVVAGLAAAGVEVSGVTRSSRLPTAGYTAVLDGAGDLAFGLADMEIFDDLGLDWADAIGPALSRFDLWVIDANLPGTVLEQLLRRFKGEALVAADPVSVAKSVRLRSLLDTVDVVFPDRAEAAALSGLPTGSRAEIAAAADRIRDLGAGTVIVTLGADGLYVADGAARAEFLPAIERGSPGEVTGAGDALVAGYVWGLLADEPDPALCGLAAACLALETIESAAPALSPARLLARLSSSVAR